MLEAGVGVLGLRLLAFVLSCWVLLGCGVFGGFQGNTRLRVLLRGC